MTANEWLKKHAKRPYALESRDCDWHWTHGECDLPDEQDWRLPEPVFQALSGEETYPDCKVFDSEAKALWAFREAFARAVAAGWNPEEVP